MVDCIVCDGKNCVRVKETSGRVLKFYCSECASKWSEPVEDLKRPEEWEEILGIKVLDPDGWDRNNIEESWSIPVSRDAFMGFAMCSTIQMRPGSDGE